MKKVNSDDLRDLWLKKYHNTTTAELIEKHPKEVLESPEWFKLYPCTQEQCDEWVIEAKELIRKTTRLSKKIIEKEFWYIYLNLSPYVEPINKEDNG